MNTTNELATLISNGDVAVFFTYLDLQCPNSWRSKVWAGVRVCHRFTGEVPPCVWGECDFHVNWLHVSRIRSTHWRLNDDFDIDRRRRRLTRNIRIGVSVLFVVSKFSRPYLLTYNTGSTDYINAVFIDVSHSHYC